MQRRWKRPVMVALSLLISAAAVAFFLYRLSGNWDQVGRAFAGADYRFLVPSVAFIAGVYVLRTVRWKVFLKPVADVPAGQVGAATCIGFMSSCVLPLRAGEVIRPYVLHRLSGMSFGHAAGTAMGLERLFDLVGATFLLFLTLLLPTATGGAEATERGTMLVEQLHARGLWFAAFTLLVMAALVTMAFRPSWVLGVTDFFLRVFPSPWREPLNGFMRSAVESLSFLKSPSRVVLAVALTLGIWLCFPLSTWWVARSFDLEIPFAGVLLAQVLVTVAVVVPQAPGFIGIFQVAAMAGVQLYGVPEGEAGAFATMMWAVNVFPITAVGLAVLWYEGLNLRKLAAASRAAAEPGGEP